MADDLEGTLVVHAVPSTEQSAGGVVATPLVEFLSKENAVNWRIYRLARKDREEISKAAATYARDVATRKVSFDSAFELNDATRLYCTELVWRAYRAAGLDLVDGRFDEVLLPTLRSGNAILVSSLESSSHLWPILDSHPGEEEQRKEYSK